MVKLNSRYTLAGKVIVVVDVVYDEENNNFIFYKEEDDPTDFLFCENEKTFLSITVPYIIPTSLKDNI